MKSSVAKVSVALALSLLGQTSSVIANDRVGNGGFAHVCRGADGKITSARLLDLWEADSLGGYSSDAPVEAQVEEALSKLRGFSINAYKAVGFRYDQLKNATVKVQRPLSKTEDAFPPYEASPGCDYEQVARFEPILTETGTGGLRIYSEIYDSPYFSNSDRAALFVHEAIYYVDRYYNDAENSQRTRALTGHLMSASLVPDAVRMAFLLLLATDVVDDSESIAKPILAVPNPREMKVKVARMFSIDGLSQDELSTEGKKLYRCVIGPQFPRSHEIVADSGYQPLEKLISYDNPFNYGVATIGADEFDVRSGEVVARDNNYKISNSISAQCYKKNSKGKEVKVPFNAEIEIENAKCMVNTGFESTFVEAGEACLIPIESTVEFNKEYPELQAFQSIGVVKSL
jgi:hypothetical protein